MKRIKAFLKRILPPPVKSFLREINGLRQLMTELSKELSAQQQRQEELINELAKRQLELAEQQRQFDERQQRALEALSARLGELAAVEHTVLEKLGTLQEKLEKTHQVVSAGQTGAEARLQQAEKQRKELFESVERVRKQSLEGTQYASEAVWGEIFNNAISGSAWLKNKAFAPGRWAVGYPYLYVMYRVLNEARPKRILELGLGQSTRMIAQYAAAHENVEHIVVEHDPEWISFFKNDFELSERSKIVQLDREMVPYKEAEAVRVFKGFDETFKGQKFDFISIDAPLGGDMKQYARIDILGLLPECLSENFVIMIDDFERPGERRTFYSIKECLVENSISCETNGYFGSKKCAIIVSESWKFLSTL